MSSQTTSQPNTPQLGLLLFLVLGAIGALTPLAIDMYLPAMPTIAQDMGVTAGAVQITLTVYTAGFAIGQLLHGPLADSFGRRPILLFGVFFFGVASAVCATTTSIESLTLVRTAQGFAGAAAAVIIQPSCVICLIKKISHAQCRSLLLLSRWHLWLPYDWRSPSCLVWLALDFLGTDGLFSGGDCCCAVENPRNAGTRKQATAAFSNDHQELFTPLSKSGRDGAYFLGRVFVCRDVCIPNRWIICLY